MATKLKFLLTQTVLLLLFSHYIIAQPKGATNQQKIDYMKSHGMGNKLPANTPTGSIYQYSNHESFVPYSAKIKLTYTIHTSHDTTINGQEKDFSHSFGSSDYTCNVIGVCDSLYAQIRTTGGDVHYDFNWNEDGKGSFKDKKFVVTGNVSYESKEILNAYSDYVLYDNKKEHNVSEKWNLHSLSFEQNPSFQFSYDKAEDNPKEDGSLSFAFTVDKAEGSGEKVENENKTDLIGDPSASNPQFTKANYLAGLLQTGLNNNALQGELNNKGSEPNAIPIDGLVRMIANDAIITKVKNGFTIDKGASIHFKKGNVDWTVSYHCYTMESSFLLYRCK